MNENFIKVIEALVVGKIRVELNSIADRGIVGTIDIGSKTGTGSFYWVEEDNEMIIETRYGKKDLIDLDNILDDIAYVAWGWYLDYKDRGYFPSDTWLPHWMRMGLIEEVKKTVTDYKIL